MTRTEFVRLCGTSCLALVGMQLLPEKAFAALPVEQDDADTLVVAKEKFIKKKGEEITYRSYIKLSSANLDYPLVVYRFAEDDYAALLMLCTHRGAELNINGEILTCPAHDSEFSSRGEVLQGPADEPLKTFPVTTNEQNIYINLAQQ